MEKKVESANKFDSLAEVVPGKDSWRFIVRVLRMWRVPAFLNPTETNSIEMVLVDEQGAKIHASIRKQLIYMFENKVVEGQAYQMSLFSVGANVGSYRTTLHPYKLIFQMKTKVKLVENAAITLHGLSVTSLADINHHTHDSDFLVDVIGLMTGISPEREYIRDGKITKMIVMELTDESGKIECALFGDYVDELKAMMGRGGNGMPIIVIQFAKVKIFRDKASVQNVLNTTRIMVNPEIPEADIFRAGLAVQGIDASGEVQAMGLRVRPSLEDEFLRMHPRKSIAELVCLDEEGVFVIGGKVEGLVEGSDWWYSACRCHRSVSADSGSYYCNGCVRHVFQVVPRFKVKVKVNDGECEAVFVLFDNDVSYIVEKSCARLVADAKGENAGFYPSVLENLIGRKMLFVVDHSSSPAVRSDGTYRIRRVCTDGKIIEMFENGDANSSNVKGNEDESSELNKVDDVAVGAVSAEMTSGLSVEPDEVGKGSVSMPKMVPAALLGKRKLTKAVVEDCKDLNDDIQGEIGADADAVPGAVDSPTSSDNITINQMIGASRSKRNLIKSTPRVSVDISDDDEVVPETQVNEFLDELIVSPPAAEVKQTKFEMGTGGRLRRNLTKVFEEVAATDRKKRLKPVKVEKE